MAFDKNISFILGQGGLGSPLPGYDYISGMLFNSTTVPSGFTAGTAKALYSINDAISYGIVGDWSDETKATAGLTVSTVVAGDTINIKVVEPYINSGTKTSTFGTYTITSTDTTTTAASYIASMINIGSTLYSASASTTKVTVSARPGLGATINGTGLTVTITGTSTTTQTTFTGGVSGLRAPEYYQISEFFRLNPKGVLWVMYYTGSTDFTNINKMQIQSGNSIRQFGAFNSGATSSGQITTDADNLQTQGNTMFANYVPASIIYAPNLYSVTDLSTLPNLRQRTDNYVSCVIGQDGAAAGAWMSIYTSASCPSYGAVLGLLSASRVCEDIAWVGSYNITDNIELATPAISNKSLYSTLYTTSYNLLNQLDGYGYIFNMTRPNIIGTWVNDSHVCIAKSSDYAYIERNRTIDKVVRYSYIELSPLINSPVLLNSDGTLSAAALTIFEDAEKPLLDQMVQEKEISAYKIIINPNQNVQSTSTISVSIQIVGIGVARNITVTLGYVLAIK